MIKYIIKRILLIIPVALIIVTIVFFLMRLAPGDPARIMLGLYSDEAAVARLTQELGLDRPITVQYLSFLKDLLKGDFGISFRTGRPVIRHLIQTFPATFILAISSLFFSILIGTPIGVISATKKGRLSDRLSMFLAITGVSMPVFWSGLILMQIFSLKLGWLPVAGYGTWRHMIMPTIAVSVQAIAFMARLIRSEMLEVLNKDYVNTARSKGLSELRVIYFHALRNAMLPAITTIGMRFGRLLGGTVIIETVFAWPGLGRLMITSINSRDYFMIQGTIILLAFIFVIVNLLVDLTYFYLDPRIKYD